MNYMKQIRRWGFAAVATLLVAPVLTSQVPAKDPAARLREALPADVAQRVLARIADARAHQLPAEALENRALKFAAKGVDPRNIEQSVNEQAARMEDARAALSSGRGYAPAGDEIEAGAEVMRKGVDGAAVSRLAKSAPSGRSLAVPLFVIGSLIDRGLSSDEALDRVLTRLKSRASDGDLETMPGQLPPQAQGAQGAKPAGMTGREWGQSHRPSTAGPPAGVPGNAGKKANRGQSHKPPSKK
jgi:hypothetical protein